MKITETNFIEQLKEHNEKALSYMIQQYGGLLSSVVNRHLRLLKEYREECLNDVFLGIWKKIGYYDEKKSSFANWAAGIARYKAVDYLRKYYKNASYENIDDLDIPQNDKGLEEIVEREISDELEQMLGCLGEQDKEIFLKLYMEEKDMEQVSQETGLSKNVIYNRISRGRRKIQKEYPGEKEA